MNQKRPIHTLQLQCVTLHDAQQLVKRDPYMSKETSPHITRDRFINVKRDASTHESKDPYNRDVSTHESKDPDNTLLLQYFVLSQQLVERDLYMSKETSPHITTDRFIHVKRDVSTHESKDTYNTLLLQCFVLSQQLGINVKRDIYISKEMSLTMLKETYKYTFFACLRSASELLKETSVYDTSNDTHTCQKRPVQVKRDHVRLNETNTGQKRPTQVKRDLYMSTET